LRSRCAQSSAALRTTPDCACKHLHGRQEQVGFLPKRNRERIDADRRDDTIAMDRLPSEHDLVDGDGGGAFGDLNRQVGDSRHFFE
jgi:hypothetical protein